MQQILAVFWAVLFYCCGGGWIGSILIFVVYLYATQVLPYKLKEANHKAVLKEEKIRKLEIQIPYEYADIKAIEKKIEALLDTTLEENMFRDKEYVVLMRKRDAYIASYKRMKKEYYDLTGKKFYFDKDKYKDGIAEGRIGNGVIF